MASRHACARTGENTTPDGDVEKKLAVPQVHVEQGGIVQHGKDE